MYVHEFSICPHSFCVPFMIFSSCDAKSTLQFKCFHEVIEYLAFAAEADFWGVNSGPDKWGGPTGQPGNVRRHLDI